MSSVYESWIGQSVVLQVAAGGLKVPLRGVIVGVSGNAIQFRMGQEWDIEIYERLILAVEQDSWACMVMN